MEETEKETATNNLPVQVSPLPHELGVLLVVVPFLCFLSLSSSFNLTLGQAMNETLTLTHPILKTPECRATIGQSLFSSLSYQTSSLSFPVLASTCILWSSLD